VLPSGSKKNWSVATIETIGGSGGGKRAGEDGRGRLVYDLDRDVVDRVRSRAPGARCVQVGDRFEARQRVPSHAILLEPQHSATAGGWLQDGRDREVPDLGRRQAVR
jgi:hypothetical protein